MKASTSQFAFGILVGVLLTCVGFAWLGQRAGHATGGGSARSITVAHGLPIEHPVHAGIEEFGRELEKLSGGTLNVDIFPGAQLGNETVCLEKTQQGEIDITKVSCAPIGNFVPVFKLFSLPYLFRDRDHYWRVLDSDVGNDLLTELSTNDSGDSSDLVGMTWFDAGSRSFYATRELEGPASLAGLKDAGVNIRSADTAQFQKLTEDIVKRFATGDRKTFVDRIKDVKRVSSQGFKRSSQTCWA